MRPALLLLKPANDIVMVNIDKGQYYAISEIAREIWRVIERPTMVSDLIGNLVADYKVERTLCEKETLLFLEDLLAEHLLQVRNGPPS